MAYQKRLLAQHRSHWVKRLELPAPHHQKNLQQKGNWSSCIPSELHCFMYGHHVCQLGRLKCRTKAKSHKVKVTVSNQNSPMKFMLSLTTTEIWVINYLAHLSVSQRYGSNVAPLFWISSSSFPSHSSALVVKRPDSNSLFYIQLHQTQDTHWT